MPALLGADQDLGLLSILRMLIIELKSKRSK